MRPPRQPETTVPGNNDPHARAIPSQVTHSTTQLLARGLAHNALNALHYVSGSVMLASQQIEGMAQLLPQDQQAGALAEAQHTCAAAFEGISKAQDGIRALQNLVVARLPDAMQPRSVSDIISRGALTVGAQTSVKVDTSSDAMVMAFGSQLEDVLINLIKNAQEAGGATCQISIWAEADAAQQGVTIIIADNGPGIDATIASSIFDPSFSTKTRGSGIGLAVSRHIIKAHGGQLQLDTSVSRGARFTIWLPLANSRRQT